MKKILRLAVLVVGLVLPTLATSQSLAFERSQLIETCSMSPQICAAAVNAVIVQLKAQGITGAALNSQLGAVAGSVIEAAQSATGADYAAFGNAMEAVANSSTDKAQVASIRNVVASIASGDLDRIGARIASGSAVGSSPG